MRKRPLSVAEYHLMGEVGIFAPGERVELIEGEIIEKPPIGSTHSIKVRTMPSIQEVRLELRVEGKPRATETQLH